MKVGIFSLVDFQKHGGLELYIRSLATRLEVNGNLAAVNGAPLHQPYLLSQAWMPVVRRLLPLMTRRNLRPICRLYAEMYGYRWCKQATSGANVIHYVGTGWDLLGFPLAKIARRKRIPITCLPAVHPDTWGDSHLDLDLYKSVDGVFVLSDFEGRHLQNRGLIDKRITRTACAPERLPTESPNPGLFRESDPDSRYILFVGRKSKEKGYHTLRKVVADLINDGQKLRLISIGRDVDPPYPAIPNYADIDLGSADDRTKQDAFAACDLFVLPSEAESFGIVYVEAWTHAKPVICGSAPASQELVKRHDGGIATDGTERQLKEAILSVLNAQCKGQSWGNRGKSSVEVHYNWENIVGMHKQVWSKLGS